ncbi:CAP domain-containing protein [Myxozyma melibiosi]|uniref:CAP domain-containing protein n=1 Tax=Myxozyma melibiosi TaxID=54550 RepID=A0ABR1EZC1_9ASCO
MTSSSSSSSAAPTTSVLAAAASAASSTSSSATSSSASASASTTLTADEQDALDVQNAAREAVGVPDLTWSADLTAEAQSYADYLSANDLFVHSGVAGEGENLYWSSSTASGQLADAAESFVSEKTAYDEAGDPVIGDDYATYGHYTQIIWKTTTEVGCAESEGYVVCRYYPQGNYVGESPLDPAN